MSNNTNSLFWIITGAVIVLAVFLLISSTNNNTVSKVFDSFGGYFSERFSINNESNENEEEGVLEADPEEERIIQELYDKYIQKGWNIMDIAVEKGVACIAYNYTKNGNNHFSWQILVINTNDFEVHLKNLKWTYFDSNTHEILLTLSPYEWQLDPNGMVMSGTANSVPMASIDHYLVFTWGD